MSSNKWRKPRERVSLLRNNKNALERLNRIWLHAQKRQQRQLGSDSTNDRKHCLAVDKFIRMIITNARIGLSPADYFILSVSAAYHDIDKAVADKRIKKRLAQEHGNYSGKMIMKNPVEYGLLEDEAKVFSFVSTYHFKGCFRENPPFAVNLKSFPRTPVKPMKLAPIFYLADRMDIGLSRADDLFLDLSYPEGNIPGKALARNTIKELSIYEDSDKIVVRLRDMPSLSPEEKRRRFRSVETSIEMINNEMKAVEIELSTLGLPCQFSVDREDLEIEDKDPLLKRLSTYVRSLRHQVKA